jgi:hypothetical protein
MTVSWTRRCRLASTHAWRNQMASPLWRPMSVWKDSAMRAEIIVSLSSTGVAALAVAASAVTTILSLRGQRDNTRATLEAQRALAVIQEEALRERTSTEILRAQRASLYKSVIEWAEGLLGALESMTADQALIPKRVWHIDPTAESDLDLYASDLIHTRFNALRGLLIALVEGSTSHESPLVSWTEHDGKIQTMSIGTTPSLCTWVEQEKVRDKARDDALDLISSIRAEVQGRNHSGYFVSYRLDRD